MINTVFVKLDRRAVDVWHEASKEAVSNDPLVRAIIDNNLGFINLAHSRPADVVQERILKLTTNDAVTASHEVAKLPGVVKTTLKLAELSN